MDVPASGVPKLARAAGGEGRLAPTPPLAGPGGVGGLALGDLIGDGRADLDDGLAEGDLDRKSRSVSS